MNLDPKKLDDIFGIESLPEAIDIDCDDITPEMSGSIMSAVPSVSGAKSSGEIEIDAVKAYAALEDLISVGKTILDNSKFIIETNPDDSEAVASAAAMVNALRDTVKEFTKLHVSKISHQRQLELERVRIENRKELMKYKFDEMTKLMANKNNPLQLGTDGGMVPLIPFNQEKIIEEIFKKHEKH